MTSHRLVRVVIKAAAIFTALNLILTLIPPETLGRLSLYGWLTPYRVRLPYGAENAPYNVYTTNLPAMFASHAISRPRADDEFRLVILGDSGAWGWWLPPDDILSSAITARGAAIDGRRVVAYNLAYPNMSLTKDLVLLDEALGYDPDLIVWLVTLNSFAPSEQMDSGLVFDNPARVRRLITCCGLMLNPDDPRFRDTSFPAMTLAGQRRDLSALLRYQISGFAWATTGMDIIIPDPIPRTTNDYAADESWKTFAAPTTLTTDDLAFDAFDAGAQLTEAAGVPLWVINAPTYRGDGANSDLRYNLWYPRWAYDQYRALLGGYVAAVGLPYRDLWAAVDPAHFTDSPAHLDAEGTRSLADMILTAVQQGR